MDYVLQHWKFLHLTPIAFESCLDPKSRKKACLWLFENVESFDQWVLSVWILDRFPNEYSLQTLVAIACIARKFHATEYHAKLNRNKFIYGCLTASGFSLSTIMNTEKKIMSRVHWALPSFQITLCMDNISRTYLTSFDGKASKTFRDCVLSWCLIEPVRSCASLCIVPFFTTLQILRRDDTKWLRGLAFFKVSYSPYWLPVGRFIEESRQLEVSVCAVNHSYTHCGASGQQY